MCYLHLNREGLAKAEWFWHHGSMPKPKAKKQSKRNPTAPNLLARFEGEAVTALPVLDFSSLLSGIVMRTLGTPGIILLFTPWILAVWLSAAWSADITPVPPRPLESRPDNPQAPSTPPPSRIDPGIERRPQTIPDPRSSITPPNVDPKMAIDPETAPPAMEKTKPAGSNVPPRKPSTR